MHYKGTFTDSDMNDQRKIGQCCPGNGHHIEYLLSRGKSGPRRVLRSDRSARLAAPPRLLKIRLPVPHPLSAPLLPLVLHSLPHVSSRLVLIPLLSFPPQLQTTAQFPLTFPAPPPLPPLFAPYRPLHLTCYARIERRPSPATKPSRSPTSCAIMKTLQTVVGSSLPRKSN